MIKSMENVLGDKLTPIAKEGWTEVYKIIQQSVYKYKLQYDAELNWDNVPIGKEKAEVSNSINDHQLLSESAPT